MSHWQSMTGYGQASGTVATTTVHVEVRSVNQKNRDVRVLTQPRVLLWEHEIAKLVEGAFGRGKFDVRLWLERGAEAAPDAQRAALHRLRGERLRLHLALGERPPLHVRDLPAGGDDGELPLENVLDVATAAIDELRQSRQREGAALHALVAGHLETLAAGLADLRNLQSDEAAARAAALNERVAALAAQGLSIDDQNRVGEEVALMLVRGDVAEELDRLDAHLAAAHELLQREGAVGKRLDVLAQECGREVHTAAAKSATAAAKAHAVELRHVVEQLREQVQNVE